MKRMIILCIAALLLALCVQQETQQGVEYTVKGCNQARFLSGSYEYTDGNLTVYIMRNCCSDEILVEKAGNTYKIIEKDKDGKICKCNCMSTVEIKNAEKDAKVVFVDFTGEEKELKNLAGAFCGWSTYASCKTDADCTVGGCSGQVCMGKGEDVVTTCEWKECYDAKKYGMTCACVDGVCQWAQS